MFLVTPKPHGNIKNFLATDVVMLSGYHVVRCALSLLLLKNKILFSGISTMTTTTTTTTGQRDNWITGTTGQPDNPDNYQPQYFNQW
jgi:hypothetical protein